MKVLFVNENIGGHSITHLHIQRALAHHAGVTARFLTVPPRGVVRKVLGAPVPGLGRHDLDLQPLRNQLLVSAWTRRHLGPAIAAFRPDVVHVFTHNAALLSTGVLAGLPAVVAMDGTNTMNAYRLPYRLPTRFTPHALRPTAALERRVYDAADLVVPNSNYTARSLRDDYGVDPDRIRMIPYGITAPEFTGPEAGGPAAPGVRATFPRIVFVGRGIERKGGFRLLDLHQRHLADRCELVLVTPDAVPPGRNVTVVDDVRPGDGRLWEVLRDCSVFVLPSRIDQLSNAVMEGMAAGLPVVAHPIVAIADMVDAGVTGFLPPEDDDTALVTAIATLVDDPGLRERMGAAGRARFEAHYDARASTARLVEVLHEAVSRYAGPRRAGPRHASPRGAGSRAGSPAAGSAVVGSPVVDPPAAGFRDAASPVARPRAAGARDAGPQVGLAS